MDEASGLSRDEDDALCQFRELLAESIHAMSNDRLRERMRLRFGIENGTVLTLASVGQLSGVSRERIRQNEAAFFRRFRSVANRDGTPQFRFRKSLLEYIGVSSADEDPGLIAKRVSMSRSMVDQIFPGVSSERAIAWLLAFCGIAKSKNLLRLVADEAHTRALEDRTSTMELRSRAAVQARLARLVGGTLWPDDGIVVQKTRVTPVRSVNSDGSSPPPVFGSEKTGRLISFESGLERRMIETLEAADGVEWYLEQPVSIPYVFRGHPRRYVPDFLIHLTDGRVLLLEVKSLVDTPLVLNLAKFSAALRYCAKRGWGFLVAESSRGPHVPILAGFTDPMFEDSLTFHLEYGPLSFSRYRLLFPSVRYAVLAAAIVRLGLDFERPFHLSLSDEPPCEFSVRAARQMDDIG